MPDDYQPIQTQADRDVANVNAVKDAVYDFTAGFVSALGDAVDRLVPQGRDELANAIFNGSAYWPGEQPPSITPDQGGSVYGDAVQPSTPVSEPQPEQSASLEAYMGGNYSMPVQDGYGISPQDSTPIIPTASPSMDSYVTGNYAPPVQGDGYNVVAQDTAPAYSAPSADLDTYMSGGYSSYSQRLDDAAERGGNDSPGMSR